MTRFPLLLPFILVLAGACVQPTYPHKIMVELDMREVEQFQTVGVRGNLPPLSWNEDIALQDSDGDSIYTGSFVMDIPYHHFECKFVVDGKMYELTNQPNRRIEVEGKEEIRYQAVFDQAKN